jgi:hypothetical protein
MRTPVEEHLQRIRDLESDTNAVIKLILTHLDEVAALPPEEAGDPYALEERKRMIKRRLWEHHRAYLKER